MSKDFADLVIEVTRRCNLECEHCLRGCQENKDMQKSTIDTLLNTASSINNLTFTGGEPLLVPDTIIYIIDSIIEKNIYVNTFFLATNGLVFNNDLFLKLIEFYLYCEYPEGCNIAVSIDPYHDNSYHEAEKNIKKWQVLKFYSACKEHTTDYNLLSEGYAAQNQIGSRDLIIVKEKPTVEKIEDGLYFEDLIYVNVKGEIVNDCDMSYETQSKNILGTVENDDYYIIEEE